MSAEKHLQNKSDDKPAPLLSMPTWDNLMLPGRNPNSTLSKDESPQKIRGTSSDKDTDIDCASSDTDTDFGCVSSSKDTDIETNRSKEYEGGIGVSSDTDKNDTTTKMDKTKACDNEVENYNPQDYEVGEEMNDEKK